jgi:hypothetical protein
MMQRAATTGLAFPHARDKENGEEGATRATGGGARRGSSTDNPSPHPAPLSTEEGKGATKQVPTDDGDNPPPHAPPPAHAEAVQTPAGGARVAGGHRRQPFSS